MEITSYTERADTVTSYKSEYNMYKNRFSNYKSNTKNMTFYKMQMIKSNDEYNHFKYLRQWKCKKYLYFCFSRRYNRSLQTLISISKFHLPKFLYA